MELEPQEAAKEMVEADGGRVANPEALAIEAALQEAVRNGTMDIKTAEECLNSYLKAFFRE